MVPSIWQILLIVVIVVLLFGKGKVSHVMEDFGKGISAFKKGLKDEEGKAKEEKPKRQIEDKSAPAKDTKVSEDTTV